jgi:vancomycin resistance protein YoaR
MPYGTDEMAENVRSHRARGRGSWWSALTPGGQAALIAVLGVAIVGSIVVCGDVIVSAGRIHPGVRIGEIPVGSLTPVEAVARVTEESSKRLATRVTAAYKTREFEIRARDVGAKVDPYASVERAMAVGRNGALAQMISERARAWFGGLSTPAKVDGDPALLAAVLGRIAKAADIPARDATISVSGGDAHLVAAESGQAIRREALGTAILSAFFEPDRRVEVATEPVRVAVSDSDAEQALADAKRLVAGPVTIIYGQQAHNVAKEQVAGWVAFRQVPFANPAVELSQPDVAGSETATDSADATGAPAPWRRMVLVAYFDPARIGRSIASFAGKVGRPARDAQFVTSAGRVSIKAGQVGLGPDLASLARDLAVACVSGRPRTAMLQLTEVQPRLTTEAARAMGVADRIGTYTTTYSSSNKQRVNNVHLIADAFNNKLIPPGGAFSFNGTVGERTAAKGYQEAPAIVNGKLVPQLGGGICQVGTTFFNAVFFSGLPIVERRNHSFYISHYPKGRDCTVSWGGPDFKFRNDTAGWVLIRASYTNSSLTISLYGTDPGYSVEYTTSAFTAVIPHRVKETKDPLLPRGARLIEDAGVDGRNVTVVRTVYKGAQVVRTDTFVSHYNAKEEVVRVGTKAPSKPATGTPAP